MGRPCQTTALLLQIEMKLCGGSDGADVPVDLSERLKRKRGGFISDFPHLNLRLHVPASKFGKAQIHSSTQIQASRICSPLEREAHTALVLDCAANSSDVHFSGNGGPKDCPLCDPGSNRHVGFERAHSWYMMKLRCCSHCLMSRPSGRCRSPCPILPCL